MTELLNESMEIKLKDIEAKITKQEHIIKASKAGITGAITGLAEGLKEAEADELEHFLEDPDKVLNDPTLSLRFDARIARLEIIRLQALAQDVRVRNMMVQVRLHGLEKTNGCNPEGYLDVLLYALALPGATKADDDIAGLTKALKIKHLDQVEPLPLSLRQIRSEPAALFTDPERTTIPEKASTKKARAEQTNAEETNAEHTNVEHTNVEHTNVEHTNAEQINVTAIEVSKKKKTKKHSKKKSKAAKNEGHDDAGLTYDEKLQRLLDQKKEVEELLAPMLEAAKYNEQLNLTLKGMDMDAVKLEGFKAPDLPDPQHFMGKLVPAKLSQKVKRHLWDLEMCIDDSAEEVKKLRRVYLRLDADVHAWAAHVSDKQWKEGKDVGHHLHELSSMRRYDALRIELMTSLENGRLVNIRLLEFFTIGEGAKLPATPKLIAIKSAVMDMGKTVQAIDERWNRVKPAKVLRSPESIIAHLERYQSQSTLIEHAKEVMKEDKKEAIKAETEKKKWWELVLQH